MDYRGLKFIIFLSVCLTTVAGNPLIGFGLIVDQQIKHPDQHSCTVHRQCFCTEGLPFCHENSCFCLYGGQYIDMGMLVETEAPETTTENAR